VGTSLAALKLSARGSSLGVQVRPANRRSSALIAFPSSRTPSGKTFTSAEIGMTSSPAFASKDSRKDGDT
jgi:hypothetical protein